MQRNFTFTLTLAATIYRLWEDIILVDTRVVADLAADYPFPAQVSGMVVQASGGSVTVRDSKVAAPTNSGPVIVDGANEPFSASGSNGLDLTQFAFQGSVNGTIVRITIDAL